MAVSDANTDLDMFLQVVAREAAAARSAEHATAAQCAIAATQGVASLPSRVREHLRQDKCVTCEGLLMDAWDLECPSRLVLLEAKGWPAGGALARALEVHGLDCEEAACLARAWSPASASQTEPARTLRARRLLESAQQWVSDRATGVAEAARAGLVLTGSGALAMKHQGLFERPPTVRVEEDLGVRVIVQRRRDGALTAEVTAEADSPYLSAEFDRHVHVALVGPEVEAVAIVELQREHDHFRGTADFVNASGEAVLTSDSFDLVVRPGGA